MVVVMESRAQVVSKCCLFHVVGELFICGSGKDVIVASDLRLSGPKPCRYSLLNSFLILHCRIPTIPS